VSTRQLELIAAVYEAWADGEPDRAVEHLAPNVEWTAIEGAPDAGTYRGHDGVRAYMQDWLDDFEVLGFDVLDVIEAGERLVLVTRGTTRGRASGLETQLQYAQVYTFENDLLHRVDEYATREEALAAVGLGE
jgi:ketosteroid isomerase-like protein